MRVKVRKLTPAEAADGAICLQCTKNSEAVSWAIRCRTDWLMSRMKQGLSLYVAYVKRQPVGMCQCEPMEHAGWQVKDLTWMNCLFILPDYRDMGVGEKLLQFAEVDVAHRSRGLYTLPRMGGVDLTSFLLKQNFHPYDCDGEVLYGKLFRGTHEPFHARPKVLPRNRPEPNDRTVLVEHYWRASCPKEAYDSFVLRRICARYGGRVRLHSIRQDGLAHLGKFGDAPGYVFIEGAEPKSSFKTSAEDPKVVQQAVWQALRDKELV